MARVLITDGEQRAALATVRSLGRAGHHVFVCSTRERSLAGASRHCSGEAQVPNPLNDTDAFVASVGKLAERWRIDTLIPISEPSLLALLPARARFPGVDMPVASLESFARICDKAEVADEAGRVGIRVPEQRVLESPDDALALASEGRFPLVLKPSRSVIGPEGSRTKLAVSHAATPEELQQALARLPLEAYPVLAQERIIGPGVGVFLLLRGGRLRAAFSHRRIREKPPSGGVSVLRESTALDEDLLNRCLELLRAFDWEGVAMVECKISAATGVPYIMEINGRFWGSLQLAIDAGVDFPELLLRPLDDTPPVTDYRIGVRSQWEWGDVDHLLARLRRTSAELALPPGSPGRGRALLDFLATLGPGSKREVLRMGDPRPFLRESLDWMRGR